MNKNAILLQLYYWACEHDIPDQEIQQFIADLGMNMTDFSTLNMGGYFPSSSTATGLTSLT